MQENSLGVPLKKDMTAKVHLFAFIIAMSNQISKFIKLFISRLFTSNKNKKFFTHYNFNLNNFVKNPV